ncbi:hypothetical protein IWQ61_003731 [Dispira simplex]|nr:hypothetical protein IWQ61_003731 [Dispira simplex]
MTTPTPARLRRRNEQYAANINKRGQARAEKQRQKAAEAATVTAPTTTTSAIRTAGNTGANRANAIPDEVVSQAAPPKLNPYVAGGLLVLLVGSLLAQIFGHLLL